MHERGAAELRDVLLAGGQRLCVCFTFMYVCVCSCVCVCVCVCVFLTHTHTYLAVHGLLGDGLKVGRHRAVVVVGGGRVGVLELLGCC